MSSSSNFKLEIMIDSVFYKFPKHKGFLTRIEKWQ